MCCPASIMGVTEICLITKLECNKAEPNNKLNKLMYCMSVLAKHWANKSIQTTYILLLRFMGLSFGKFFWCCFLLETTVCVIYMLQSWKAQWMLLL